MLYGTYVSLAYLVSCSSFQQGETHKAVYFANLAFIPLVLLTVVIDIILYFTHPTLFFCNTYTIDAPTHTLVCQNRSTIMFYTDGVLVVVLPIWFAILPYLKIYSVMALSTREHPEEFDELFE